MTRPITRTGAEPAQQVRANLQTLGLDCRRVAAAPMSEAHRHHEVELNLLEEAVAAGDADEVTFSLSRVRANVARMGALLDDLLSLSRMGRSGDEATELDLGELARSAAGELEARLERRGVTLRWPPSWPPVRYPRSEAYQLLANLLGNAAKFAGGPGRAPLVRLSWTAEGGAVTLRVSDNGPGVPTEQRERVFALFQKLDPGAKGTGVGLAIVKRIVERHLVAGKPGRVWVEDSDLGGASFAVTMPLAT